AEGITVLPYLDGERTPRRPHATGVVSGLTTAAMNRSNLARAAEAGMLSGLADARELLREQGVAADTVQLIGGGAASAAVRRIAPRVFATAVTVPNPGEYVALGAARQAAWVLNGRQDPPRWPRPAARRYEDEPDRDVRE